MPKIRLSWVPNLFTLTNLSFGFFSILLSLQSKGSLDALTLAGGLILLAAACDGLDGFAARLLKAQSEVGAQLDSLADLTTFGIAPGVLMYSLVFHQLNVEITSGVFWPAGMFVAALYPVCAAYRLARFNVRHSADSFEGLPSPVAGVIVGLMPLAFSGDIQVPPIALAIIFVCMAFLMVSTIRYAKPGLGAFRRFSTPRIVMLIAFIVAALVFVYVRFGVASMAMGLFFLLVIYIVTGLVSLVFQIIQAYRV